MGHRFDQNRNMDHLQQQIQQLAVSMQQRDEQIANLQQQLNINAGALAAAQEAANNALQVVNVQANENFASQYKELAKIFSFLPAFTGNSLKVFSFVKAVEKLLPLTQHFEHDSIVQAIKSKIEVDVLETSPSETWEEIKQLLILHFADKRDEAALIRDLHKLQCATNVEEFHEKIERNLMLLISRAKLMEPEESLSTKLTLYNDMALKTFIGGIRGIAGSVVRSQNPKNLNEALQLYDEERNYAQDHSSQGPTPPAIPTKQKTNQFTKPQQFPFQPKYSIPQFNQQYPMQQFPVQQYPIQQFPIQQYPVQQYPVQQYPVQKYPVQQYPVQQYPIQQKMIPYKLPKPTPMEVDPSIRSKNVNYVNRVNNNPDFKNKFKIEEIRNIDTNESDNQRLQPEQDDVFYDESSEDALEDQNVNFLVVSEENSQTLQQKTIFRTLNLNLN